MKIQIFCDDKGTGYEILYKKDWIDGKDLVPTTSGKKQARDVDVNDRIAVSSTFSYEIKRIVTYYEDTDGI